jgi:ribosomal protein L40E
MSGSDYVKYCPLCGADNPPQQAFCRACRDGDLTTVAVEPRRAVTPQAAFAVEPATAAAPAPTAAAVCVLTLLEDAAVSFTVREGQSVGRTAKADVPLTGVPRLDAISGRHALFTRRGTQWYVQHVGQTNFIKVDGDLFTGTEEVPIYDGTVLLLALTAFRVTVAEG